MNRHVSGALALHALAANDVRAVERRRTRCHCLIVPVNFIDGVARVQVPHAQRRWF